MFTGKICDDYQIVINKLGRRYESESAGKEGVSDEREREGGREGGREGEKVRSSDTETGACTIIMVCTGPSTILG